jgi:hypothetical protein
MDPTRDFQLVEQFDPMLPRQVAGLLREATGSDHHSLCNPCCHHRSHELPDHLHAHFPGLPVLALDRDPLGIPCDFEINPSIWIRTSAPTNPMPEAAKQHPHRGLELDPVERSKMGDDPVDIRSAYLCLRRDLHADGRRRVRL